MNILLLSFFTVVNNAGGAARVFCNMANHFAENDQHVWCVCNDITVGQPFYKLDKRCKFFNLDGSGHPKSLPVSVKVRREGVRILKQLGINSELPQEKWERSVSLKPLESFLQGQMFDVVVCYDIQALLTLYETGFSLSKVVFMFHVKPAFLLHKLTNTQKKILGQVRYMQVLLPNDVNYLESYGYTNVICIGNAVSQYKHSVKVKNSNIKRIVFISRLEKNKGQNVLIKAFARIALQYPEWVVEIWGGKYPGEYADQLMTLIKDEGMEKRIFLKGTTDAVGEILKTGDIFAFPSTCSYEAFGLAIAEAMSSELPVIAYRSCHGPNNLVQDGINGLLCEDGIEDFSKKLEILIQNPELRTKLGEKARESIKQYDPEAIWSQWDKLIQSMEQT